MAAESITDTILTFPEHIGWVRYLKTAFVHTKQAIINDNVSKLQKCIRLIHHFKNYLPTKVITNSYSDHNPFRGTNAIILACQQGSFNVLKYLVNTPDALAIFEGSSDSIASNSVDKNFHTAFHYAIHLTDIRILDLIYHYWAGDIHWVGSNTDDLDESNILENLKLLGTLISDAFDEQQFESESKQQNLVDIHGLLTFNKFQIELYTFLCSIKPNCEGLNFKIQNIEMIKSIFGHALRLYKKYSEEKVFRIKKIRPCEEEHMQNSLKDKSTLYWDYYLLHMYSSYFCKLDANVATLLLDNLYWLKRILPMPSGSYSKMESQLYLLLSYLNSFWEFNGGVNYTALSNGLHVVVYLERLKFQAAFEEFVKTLNEIAIKALDLGKKRKIPLEELNCLSPFPQYRDAFSVRKISKYMEYLLKDIKKTDMKYFSLTIERILQVLGEFLKVTEESNHLSLETASLLEVEIPFATIKTLKSIRDLLSHVENGKLLLRIDLETNSSDIFNEVFDDLREIQEKMIEVMELHKYREQISIIRHGFQSIESRKESIFGNQSVDFYLHDIGELKTSELSIYAKPLVKKLIQMIETETGMPFSESLKKEVEVIALCRATLREKLTEDMESLGRLLLKYLPNYIRALEFNLKQIYEQWKDMKPECVIPDLNMLERWKFIKTLLGFIVIEMKYFDDNSWEIKKGAFSKRVKNLNNSPTIEELETVSQLLEIIKIPIQNQMYLSLLPFFQTKKDYDENWQGCTNYAKLETSSFEGLQKLEKMLGQSNFLTTDEIRFIWQSNGIKVKITEASEAYKNLICYFESKIKMNLEEFEIQTLLRLNSNFELSLKKLKISAEEKKILSDDYDYSVKPVCPDTTRNTEPDYTTSLKILEESCAKYSVLCEHIRAKEPIDRQDYDKLVKVFDLDEPARKLLLNLVKGEVRHSNLAVCLIQRVSLLKTVFNNQSRNQLVLKFSRDPKFQIVVELLLTDIMNLVEKSELRKKSSKLLAGIDLRNVLQHGNALIEVLGIQLDINEFPTEIISKALSFVEDENSIQAIHAFFQSLNKEQIDSVQLIKQSERCFGYLKIVLSDHRNIIVCDLLKEFISKGLSCVEDENSLKALQKLSETLDKEQKDLVNLWNKSERCFDYLKLFLSDQKFDTLRPRSENKKEDEIEINLFDAIKTRDVGQVERTIVEVAINLDLLDSHGKSCLHYAVSGRMTEIVKILLDSGADVNIRTKKDRKAPLHYAVLNGFDEIVKILLESGADCQAVDKLQKSPLFYAVKGKNKDIIKLIVIVLTRQVGRILQYLIHSEYTS